MSEFKKKSTVKNGFITLVNEIEKLSGQHFDFDSIDSSELDIREIRRREAIEASKEIAKRRTENHKNFIKSVYASHRVNPDFTFDKIQMDQFNNQAINTAQGFCVSSSMAAQMDSEPQLFLLQGCPGSGKTVLSNCIANYFLNKLWKDVELCSYQEIKRYRTPSSTDTTVDVEEKTNKWERLCSVDLLIIDSLCQNNEKITAYDKQVIPDLLRSRRARRLPLVITTTVLPNALHAMLGDEIFESLKEYNVMGAALFGNSRRAPISFAGANLM